MPPIKRLTIEQHKAAYRYRVERCLVVFFKQDEERALKIVADWWARLSKHPRLFRSGFFMHDEPIYTAADLLQVEDRKMSEEDDHVYDEILHESLLRGPELAGKMASSTKAIPLQRPISKAASKRREKAEAIDGERQRVVA